jgi:hypothetical protein
VPVIQPIIDILLAIKGWFYQLYLIAYYWVWPFNLVAESFYQLCTWFYSLAGKFGDFGVWVSATQARLADIVSFETLWTYVLKVFPNLVYLNTWWNNMWPWFLDCADDWWSSTQVTVQGWITAATAGFAALTSAWNQFTTVTWPSWTSRLEVLKSAWDNFWTVTFPSLVSFTWLAAWWTARVLEVTGLINSAFTTREPFWAGWQDIKTTVLGFFANPFDFLWARFADWFLGPEA